MPNVNDLRKSSFLTKNDVTPPVLVTIRRYAEVNVAQEGSPVDKRWTIFFDEMEKPLILNPTNGQMISVITGSDSNDPDEFAQWVGHKVVLYNDPNVTMHGKAVGGIRVRAPKGVPQQRPTVKTPTPPPAPVDLAAGEGEGDDVPF